MKLVIAEKPSVGKTIAEFLGCGVKCNGYYEGGDYAVTWAIGHLLELCEPGDYDPLLKNWSLDSLPIFPKNYKYKIKYDTKSQLYTIANLLDKAKIVINAGDMDREGCCLVDNIIEHCGFEGKVQRLWINDFTDSFLQKGFSNLKNNDDYQGFSSAGRARAFADWMVGMNLTRCVAGLNLFKDRVSVGRVQSPALKIIVNRDAEINNFKPVNFYKIKASLSDFNYSFFVPIDNKYLVEGKCFSLSDANSCVPADSDFLVTSIDEDDIFKSAPLPFCLASLTKFINKHYSLSAKAVLSNVQSLYEKHKLVTYPRPDCRYLSEGEHSNSRNVINAIFSNTGLSVDVDPDKKHKCFNDSKLSSHSALAPTDNIVDLSLLTKNESIVYDVICRSYLSLFAGDLLFSRTSVSGLIGDKVIELKGDVCKNKGFSDIYPFYSFSDSVLPDLKINSSYSVSYKVETSKTSPPKPFNDGDLIYALSHIGKYLRDAGSDSELAILNKVKGIGTVATYPAILKSLFDSGFIEYKSNKSIVSTAKGRDFVNLLPDDVTNPLVTAQWEICFDRIEKNLLSVDDFISMQESWVLKQINQIKSSL